jgi:carbonic anhydrase
VVGRDQHLEGWHPPERVAPREYPASGKANPLGQPNGKRANPRAGPRESGGMGAGMGVIDDVLDGNAAFASVFDRATGALDGAPSRHLAVLACMDARLDIDALLGLRPGDAHVIRNAGGVATDDAIRSLVISQRLLGTRAVVLVHHTDCGMLSFRDDELQARIEQETGVRPPFAFEAFHDLEADVRQSMARIRLSPFLPHRDQVRGFVYDVRTGRLSEVSAGDPGR